MMKAINLKKVTIVGAALIGLGTATIATMNSQTQPMIAQAATSKIKVSQSSAVNKFRAEYKKAKIESIL